MRFRQVLAGLFVVTIGATTGGYAVARRAAPTFQTYDELRGAVGDDKSRAADARRFAEEQRATLADRLSAANLYRRLLEDDDKKAIDAQLLLARLHGVAGAERQRARALERARGLVRKATTGGKTRSRGKKAVKRNGKRSKALAALDKRLEHIEAALAADAALVRVVREAKKRGRSARRKALSARYVESLDVIEQGIPHYKALADVPRVARARLWSIKLRAASEGTDDEWTLKALADLVRAGGRGRDTAMLRQEVRRTRAKLLARTGQWADAVHESLVADRSVPVPLKQPAFNKVEPPEYRRSRTSADLCHKARAFGVDCARHEKDAMGEMSFYDYSREPIANGFPRERAAQTLADYTPLLEDCMREAGQTGVLDNTHLELEWSVGLDGRVGSHVVKPRRLHGSPFAKCIEGAFARFRYPPYRGEMQHTLLAFDIE